MTGTGTQADPYIVSEYTEFLTAIQTSGVYVKCADNTVWDMNIIDPTGEKYHNSGKSIYCTELDGNGAIINNLHTAISGSVSLFNIDRAIIKNLKFYNMNLTNGATFFRVNSYYAQITDCYFTGMLGEQAILFWSSGSQYNAISISKSLISIELYGNSKLANGVYRFEDSVINIPFVSSNYSYNQASFIYLANCWFTGILPFNQISSSGGNYNVINANTIKDLNVSLTNTYVINTDRCEDISSLITSNNAILVATEQLKDAEYLRSQGFPALSSNKG